MYRVRVTICVALAVLFAKTGFAAAPPAPWLARDIGSPSVSGSVSYSLGVFTINAGGADVWGSADQFQFVYQAITGDLEIVARVDSLVDTAPWAKAGVMIRSDLTAGSAHAFALLSAEHGIAFQRRRTAGASSVSTSGPVVAAPSWVRLVRSGTTVTAYTSTSGGTWTKVASDTIALNATAYVGLAVTSHNTSTATRAGVSQVSLTPRTQTLPSPQKDADIGSPAIAGSATYSSGTYTVNAAGADIWGSADQFHFVYQAMSGDFDVAARVASIANTSTAAKAGVMVRETLAANSRHAFALLTVGKGYAFQRRIDPGGLSVTTHLGTTPPPGWVRLKRTGYTFQGFASSDGVNWTSIGTDTVPMVDTVYVGIAVTSHNASAATKAIVDQFAITQTVPPANQPPTVSLTSPANGASFTAPANIGIAANASDPENRLSRVDFFNGSARIGSATAAPFSMTWPSVAAGTYTLTAQAFDADGGSATSAAATITVNAATGAPTAISFNASADHATLVTSYRLNIYGSTANPSTATAVASANLGKPTPDASGVITVNEATFFSALAPGTYQATVTAVGSAGSSQSAPVTFTR